MSAAACIVPLLRGMEAAMGTARRGLALLVALYLFVIAFPDPFVPIEPGVEGGWKFGINQGRVQGLSFGTQILYTYGPLGYLLFPHDLGHHAAEALGFGMALAAITAGLVAYGVARARFVPGLLCVVGLAAALRNVPRSEERVLLPVLLALALALGAERRDGRAPTVLTAIAAILGAAGLLMKFNLGIACATALAVYLTIQLIRSQLTMRYLVVYATMYLGAVVLLYVLAGNRAADLGFFVYHSLQISLGYAEGMTLSGPAGHVVLAVACLVLFVALATRTASSPLRLTAAVMVLPLLVAYKQGFTRHDLHAVAFFATFVGCLAVLALCARTRRDTALIAAGLLLGLVVTIDTVPRAFRTPAASVHPARRQRGAIARSTRRFVKLLNPRWGIERMWRYAHWSEMRADTARWSRRSLRVRVLPPDVRAILQTGTVDVVPTDPTYVIANGLRWNPRMMFQSFSVLTPVIDRWNARHFVSAEAPDFVLYSFDSIDGRHPFFDEPATLREIFCRYAIERRAAELFVLRRGVPRCGELIAGERLTAHWNEEVPVPADQAGLHVRLDLRYRLAGQVFRFLFRAPRVRINVTYSDGTEAAYRLIPALAREGLWIGHLPRDLAGVQGLLTGAPPAAVRSFRLVSFPPGWFAAGIPVEFARWAAPIGSALESDDRRSAEVGSR